MNAGGSRKVAWAVHALTASGILCGLMGVLSVMDSRPRAALLWLMGALVIDGLDGPMARGCAVRVHLPNIDGNVLDLVIDYVTCVVAPVLFLHQFNMLPAKLSLVGAGTVLLTALYCYSRTDLTTPDNYFNGFPAMWGLVVNVLFVVQSSANVNLAVLLVFSCLTVSNMQFPHIVRVVFARRLTLLVVSLWLTTMVLMTIDSPRTSTIGSAVLFAGTAYLMALAVRRTLCRRRDSEYVDPINAIITTAASAA